MKKLFLIALTLVINNIVFSQENIAIIPKPVSVVMHNGNFVIDAKTTVLFDVYNKELANAIQFFSSSIKEISGIELRKNLHQEKSISFQIKQIPNIGNEGYQLKITSTNITITANSKAGIIYAIQSILQLLPGVRTNAILKLPCVVIEDYPRFEWRGMHLDVSRHFFSPEIIKEYINLMARYKMNIFHWHLVDDQGWRIEIKKYPKLTSVGAWRVDYTNIVWGNRPQAKPNDDATYGGYYTQEQIKEIVAYAAQRNITIVPEIEMPGHVASAIAAYPELSCSQKFQLPLTGGNYTNISSNYCAGNDSVFVFLQNVLTEVMQLFPSKYIHVGGDEVDKTPWKNCIKCQNRIKKEGLKNEEELQSYFMKRIEKFIISKNRKMIGWDEILEGGLAPEATVMSWRGETGGIEAAKQKHNVVMTPGAPCYFDHYQTGPEGEPLAIGGMNTLKNVYDYEPIPKELNNENQKYVLGAQANLWTEFITTAEHVEYMVLPRMLALSEVLWSKKDAKDWIDFNKRLQPSFKYFDQKGFHYNKGNYNVTIKPVSKNNQLVVTLSSEIPGATIVYTTNGTDPNIGSNIYTNPITISTSLTLKAAVVVNNKVMNIKPAEQKFVIHKAVGKNVTYQYPISKYYTADGNNSLTDGITGTFAVNKYWHGINGNDLIATIDLTEIKSITNISINCLQKYADWIFLPRSVLFEVSENGVNYTTVGKDVNNISSSIKEPTIKTFSATFHQENVRYIRVSAYNIKECPKGHPGEGKPAWLFADEIMVN
ncbi:MAG: family 20 glycosylhydrolase [Bacteroidetes bacterium]|nr:family 20 glycosylhydrolase [Bacteroidota bacterium]MBS1650069.1 family 20 glycosylhydrolase [Bacteroidota bacterium]